MSYIDTLKGPDRQRYELKLRCLYGALGESDKENSLRVLDPYQLDNESWIDDVYVYGDMVACDGPDCPYEWFHFECAGLSKEPLGEWYCSECRDAEMQIDIANMQDSVHILFVSFTLHLKLNCCAKFLTKYIIIIVYNRLVTK